MLHPHGGNVTLLLLTMAAVWWLMHGRKARRPYMPIYFYPYLDMKTGKMCGLPDGPTDYVSFSDGDMHVTCADGTDYVYRHVQGGMFELVQAKDLQPGDRLLTASAEERATHYARRIQAIEDCLSLAL